MPPKKKAAAKGPRGMGKPISPGQKMLDLTKKEWKLGPVIGQGGFGYLYLGGPAEGGAITSENGSYVIKVEPHANGPLFVELAFYQRVAKPDMVSTWMKEKKKKHLGIPLYIATGSFEHDGNKYRFLVMDRFGTDVEKIYKEHGYVFPESTVYSLGLRIIDALEYMHSKEYVHADIKSSNIMLGFSKADKLKVYLLDYGLAYRYCPGGQHVAYKEDPKRRHDGTIEYTSRDAHKGCAPSRRGDLEILGYCMLQWLCKKLPWEKNLNDKEYVMKEKIKYMNDIPKLLKECLPGTTPSSQLKDFLNYINTLEYDSQPDYDKVRTLFKAGLKKAGHSDDGANIILPTGSPSASPKKRRSARGIAAAVSEDENKPPPPVKRGRPKASSNVAAKKSKPDPPTPEEAPKKPPKAVGPPKSKSAAATKGDNKSGQVIHKRVRRKNVPTRDFAQSP
ncbi:serine/threonine-protein kinase VRK1-like [Clytia hemisphaerica]|uniref:non-specific serine/threonine protein kinase n=1 Tax=Clytia hemisphaerica TaxID=252671 RepID=A0A7M5X2B1_9CNID